VVPAVDEKWSYPPFDAHIDEKGDIYGRGTQDMKSVGIQYLEALCGLRDRGVDFERTIHILFVPDEEIGGIQGMGLLVRTKEWRELNAGVVLDEGLASPTETYTVFYGERAPIWLRLRARGPTGHASRFIANSANERLFRVINKIYEFRKEQEKEVGMLAECGCSHVVAKKLGDVTTVNCTMLKSGVSTDDGKTYCLNVIPSEAEAGFDMRVATTIPLDEFKIMLESWAAEENVEVDISYMPEKHAITPMSDCWWKVFEHACEKAGINIEPEVFPAATDSR